MEATTKTLTIQDAVNAIRSGNAWVMPKDSVSKLTDYIEKYYPELKLDTDFHFAPGMVKLQKLKR